MKDPQWIVWFTDVTMLVVVSVMVFWANRQNKKVRNMNIAERKLDTAILSRKLAQLNHFRPEDMPVYLRDDLLTLQDFNEKGN